MPERRLAEKINKPFVSSEGRQQLEKRTQPIGHKRLHLAPVGRKAAWNQSSARDSCTAANSIVMSSLGSTHREIDQETPP